MSEYIVRMPPDMPYEIRAELNAWYVESEPIVRCRDCRYIDHEEAFAGDVFMAERLWCMRPDGNGDYMRFEIDPDGFCKWGEKRDAAQQ